MLKFLLPLMLISFAASAGDRTSCLLPPDQGTGSLLGSWAALPVKLVFDEAFYAPGNENHLQALRNAVGTWNGWARLRGKTAFVVVDETHGRAIPKETGCSQSAYTNSVSDAVGLWMINGSGDRKNQRATCGMNDRGEHNRLMPEGVHAQTDWLINGKIKGASVLFNYELAMTGPSAVDAESVMVGQLGHVLGLLGSCSTGGADLTTAPSCNGAPREYQNSVMNPYLAPGEIRRELGTNDYNRINCLY